MTIYKPLCMNIRAFSWIPNKFLLSVKFWFARLSGDRAHTSLVCRTGWLARQSKARPWTRSKPLRSSLHWNRLPVEPCPAPITSVILLFRTRRFFPVLARTEPVQSQAIALVYYDSRSARQSPVLQANTTSVDHRNFNVYTRIDSTHTSVNIQAEWRSWRPPNINNF